MGPIYEFLGLTVGLLQDGMSPEERQPAYQADITFGTNNQFGFDYLRDNMVHSFDRKVQGPLDFAIIDEIDNILVDEARTPLIISGSAAEALEQVEHAIHCAALTAAGEAGERLPSDGRLAETFGISRSTVRRVLED